MIASLILGWTLLAMPQDYAPDPVTVQVQACFQAPEESRLTVCEKALALPTKPAVHAHLLAARALWQMEDRTSDVIPMLRMAVDSDREDITCHLILGWYLDRVKQPKEAEAEYREVVSLAEGNTEYVDMDGSVLHVLGESGQDLGDFYQTRARGFERIDQPKFAAAYYSAAIANWGNGGDYERSVAAFENALRLTPANPGLQLQFGRYLRRAGVARQAKGEDEKAREIFTEAVKHAQEACNLVPDDAKYRHELGLTYVAAGDLRKGIDQYRQALWIQPEFPELERDLRVAVLASGGPDPSVQVASHEDSQAALDKLKICINGNGMRGRLACSDALKIGLSGRNAAKAHFYRGEALKGKQAAEEYAAAVDADRSFALAYFRLGERISLEEPGVGSREEALGNLLKAAELRPSWLAAYELMASEFERTGRIPEAITALRRVLQGDPEDQSVQMRLRKLEEGLASAAPSPGTPAPVSASAVESARRSGAPVPGLLAARSGLLLGLSGYTYWIVRDGDNVRVNGPVQRMLVQRSSGWWEAGIAGPPLAPEDQATAPEKPASSALEIPWAVPAGAKHPEYAPQNPEVAGQPHETSSFVIDWLGDDYASIHATSSNTSADNQVQSSDVRYVVTLDSLNARKQNAEAVKLLDIADPAGKGAMNLAIAVEQVRCAAEPSPDQKCAPSAEPTSWSVKREKGRWRLERPEEGHDGNSYRAFDIPLDPPEKLVGDNDLGIDWDAVQDAAPDAIDAFTSPRQDLVIVVTPSRLVVFQMHLGKIAKRLLTRPIGSVSPVRVVTAQWAVGAIVERWNKALAPMFEEGQ